jgi:environmental stress-induced protein Ves
VIITPRDWRPQPWKNGRGVTHEVLRVPDVDDYDVRISVGQVDVSSMFSKFAGYTRYSLLLDGGPISLEGRELESRRFLELDGMLEVHAHAEAPGRLLNILARAGAGIGVGTGDRDDVDIIFDLVTHTCRKASRAFGAVAWIDLGVARW